MRWALSLTVLASGAALFPKEEGGAAAPAAPHEGGQSTGTRAPDRMVDLPSQLAALGLESAERDPFALPELPPLPPPAAPPAPPPSPSPSAPPLNYRYLGELVDPQGLRKVYLARSNNKEVLVERGARLDEGYLVEAITATEVQLLHEPMQQRASIPIPLSNPS